MLIALLERVMCMVLGVDSLKDFLGESVTSGNRKSRAENNFIAKMEGNARRTHPSQSYFKKFMQAKACKISHILLVRPFKCNECDYSATEKQVT